MCVSPAVLTPSTTPQPIGIFDTPYGQFVADAGYPDLAGRIEECSTMVRKHKDAAGHVWLTSYYCERKSCEVCNRRIAERDFKKYSVLDKEPFTGFCHIELAQAMGKKARKLLHRMKNTLVLSKDGWRHGRWTCGILLLALPEAIPDKVLRGLQALDPLIYILRHERTDFLGVLKHLLSPGLPPDFADRLAMEGKRRGLVFQGASREKRRTLSVEESPTTDKDTKTKVSHCPKCGLPEISHTHKMRIGTLLADERWISDDPSPPPG